MCSKRNKCGIAINFVWIMMIAPCILSATGFTLTHDKAMGELTSDTFLTLPAAKPLSIPPMELNPNSSPIMALFDKDVATDSVATTVELANVTTMDGDSESPAELDVFNEQTAQLVQSSQTQTTLLGESGSGEDGQVVVIVTGDAEKDNLPVQIIPPHAISQPRPEPVPILVQEAPPQTQQNVVPPRPEPVPILAQEAPPQTQQHVVPARPEPVPILAHETGPLQTQQVIIPPSVEPVPTILAQEVAAPPAAPLPASEIQSSLSPPVVTQWVPQPDFGWHQSSQGGHLTGGSQTLDFNLIANNVEFTASNNVNMQVDTYGSGSSSSIVLLPGARGANKDKKPGPNKGQVQL